MTSVTAVFSCMTVFSRTTVALVVCGVMALLVSCAGGPSGTPLDIRVEQARGLTGKLWPAPPEVPRYRYEGELLGEQNFHVSGEDNGDEWAVRRWLRTGWYWLTGLKSAPRSPVVLQRPQNGVTDGEGRIYVTDVSRQAVFIFDAVSGRLRLWEYADGQRRFQAPAGVAVDHRQRLLVSDAELGAVFRFSVDGSPQGSFGAGILERPTGIAFDPELQQVYVADTEANNVKVFDGDGLLLDTLGFSGEGAGLLNRPVYLAFAKGLLYVSDSLNARIQVFDREGNPVRVIGRRGLYVGNFTRPKGVAVDNEGHVYVVEGFYDHLLVFNPEGRLLLGIGGTGKEPGRFYLPAGVWTDGANRIYVADMFNGRVSIYQFLGEEQ